MELVKFLSGVSSPEFLAMVLRWCGYAALVVVVLILVLLVFNGTGQARVNSRRF